MHWAMRTAAARTWPCMPRGALERASGRTDPPERSGAFSVLGGLPTGGVRSLRDTPATMTRMEPIPVTRVLLASPRGYCAGVERAVETVELALAHYGAPIYVRKQIVHNAHVVRDLEARGAVFVDEESEVPEGATIVYSAHGVAPAVHRRSGELRHNVIDATCPLVTKVHVQARRYAADGYTVLLIGHAGHEEVVGTMGEAPESTVLVESVEDVGRLEFPPGTRLAYITQTTLSVDETREIITALRARFPDIHAPKKEDICYATSNRQWAVKEMLDADRPPARDRVAKLLQLEPARGRLAREWRRLVPRSTTRRTSTRRGSRASAPSA